MALDATIEATLVASNDARAAYCIDRLFEVAVDRLPAHPLMGREGALPGTRELVPHPRYRVVYDVLDPIVVILALVHTSRQWPPDQS